MFEHVLLLAASLACRPTVSSTVFTLCTTPCQIVKIHCLILPFFWTTFTPFYATISSLKMTLEGVNSYLSSTLNLVLFLPRCCYQKQIEMPLVFKVTDKPHMLVRQSSSTKPVCLIATSTNTDVRSLLEVFIG